MRFQILVPVTAVAGALLLAAATPAPMAAQAAKEPPSVSLFDGKSLNGWRGYKKADAAGSRWVVQDGLLTPVSYTHLTLPTIYSV